MRTDDLDYNLPEELIAQSPATPRDSSKLLVCSRSDSTTTPRVFRDLPDLLNPGDLLVANPAKVMPARLFGYKYPTGAKIEVFLLQQITDDPALGKCRFKSLMRRRKRLTEGDRVCFPESRLIAEVIECREDIGENIVELTVPDGDVESEIERIGRIPLPPYITDYDGDLGRYQTIYASVPGSVAAPTAGLHFTPDLIQRLHERGIERAEIHLRVGWGTFSPIRSENLEDHNLHAETGELTSDTADRINEVRRNGGRIVAVGTTVTRLLETSVDPSGVIRPFKGPTDLYITPGYSFKAVDVLLTNFHLPKTSLLALVSAFLGVDETRRAYEYAVKEKFRFYSFGDAMLVV